MFCIQAIWVPHAWLLAVLSAGASKLKYFLEAGPVLDLITDETLAAKGDDIAEPTIARVMEDDDRVHGQKSSTHHHSTAGEWAGHGPAPDVNAEASIPDAWRVRGSIACVETSQLIQCRLSIEFST